MARPTKRTHELPTPKSQLQRITLEALARYEASELIRPGDRMIFKLREKVRNG